MFLGRTWKDAEEDDADVEQPTQPAAAAAASSSAAAAAAAARNAAMDELRQKGALCEVLPPPQTSPARLMCDFMWVCLSVCMCLSVSMCVRVYVHVCHCVCLSIDLFVCKLAHQPVQGLILRVEI